MGTGSRRMPLRDRIPIIAAAAAILVGPACTTALAEAPPLTFSISGILDQVGTYTRNMSTYDFSLARNSDAQFYGRTRGRFDFVGAVGRTKAVLGIEIDAIYGQTGLGDSNGSGSSECVTTKMSTVMCGFTGSSAEAGFDLNTDIQSSLQIKWLYTEFDVPLIPVPAVLRLGAQPFGAAATYKLGTYANGDFGGVNLSSVINPYTKLLFTYVAVEELLTGKADIAATPLGVGWPGSNAP